MKVSTKVQCYSVKTFMDSVIPTFKTKSSSRMFLGSSRSSASSKAATMSGSRSGRGPEIQMEI